MRKAKKKDETPPFEWDPHHPWGTSVPKMSPRVQTLAEASQANPMRNYRTPEDEVAEELCKWTGGAEARRQATFLMNLTKLKPATRAMYFRHELGTSYDTAVRLLPNYSPTLDNDEALYQVHWARNLGRFRKWKHNKNMIPEHTPSRIHKRDRWRGPAAMHFISSRRRKWRPATSYRRAGVRLRVRHLLFATPLHPKVFKDRKPVFDHPVFINQTNLESQGVADFRTLGFLDILKDEHNLAGFLSTLFIFFRVCLPQYKMQALTEIPVKDLYDNMHKLHKYVISDELTTDGNNNLCRKFTYAIHKARKNGNAKPFTQGYLKGLYAQNREEFYGLMQRMAVILEVAAYACVTQWGAPTYGFKAKNRHYRIAVWSLFLERFAPLPKERFRIWLTKLQSKHLQFIASLHPYFVAADYFIKNEEVRRYANHLELDYLCSSFETPAVQKKKTQVRIYDKTQNRIVYKDKEATSQWAAGHFRGGTYKHKERCRLVRSASKDAYQNIVDYLDWQAANHKPDLSSDLEPYDTPCDSLMDGLIEFPKKPGERNYLLEPDHYTALAAEAAKDPYIVDVVHKDHRIDNAVAFCRWLLDPTIDKRWMSDNTVEAFKALGEGERRLLQMKYAFETSQEIPAHLHY